MGHALWGAPHKVVHAVDDVSFDIHAGETLGLVGETGSGKSTLGRLVLNLLPPTAGTVRYRGEDIHALDQRQLARLRGRAQIVFQDPFSSFDPRMTVRAIVAEGMVHTELRTRAAREQRVRELLRTVGLTAAHADGYPHQFSGGQRQRIGIARALAVNPEFIVLDEPVSALDVSVQSQTLNLLVDLRAEFGLTYLFIAHDIGVVRYLCTRVAVMYLGKVVELGPAAALFECPQHPYTRELLAAVPVADPSRRNRTRRVLEGDIPSPIDPPPGCRFHTRCPHAMEVCRRVEPPLRARVEGHLAACHPRIVAACAVSGVSICFGLFSRVASTSSRRNGGEAPCDSLGSNVTSLQRRFLVITSAGLLALTLCMVGLVGWLESAKVETKLHEFSVNELNSLNTLVLSVMEARHSDVQSEASDVFDRWFEGRNRSIPASSGGPGRRRKSSTWPRGCRTSRCSGFVMRSTRKPWRPASRWPVSSATAIAIACRSSST